MIKRDTLERIKELLGQFPALAILGSRQCGKTTLAKELASSFEKETIYLDLELPSDLAKLNEPELYFEAHENRLVILDEIQRAPQLFSVLRSLIDKNRISGRFLILGSASQSLLKQSSESLAGRISYIELSPFSFLEIDDSPIADETSMEQLWIRGGYPDSFLAPSLSSSHEWRAAFIRTFLERDVPQLGFRVSAARMRRFWEMLSHVQGQIWNANSFARNFDVSAPTVRHHLDLLTDTFLLRQLQPLYVNLKKRLIKSPKVYIRDSGLLHTLLKIDDREALLGHPVLGASFEGFVIENIVTSLPSQVDSTFYRTHKGDEIDLVLTKGNQRIAVEVKYTSSPKLSKGFQRAMLDIGAIKGVVVTAGKESFPLTKNVQALSLKDLLKKELPLFFKPSCKSGDRKLNKNRSPVP